MRVLEQIGPYRVCPGIIRTDNEFRGKAMLTRTSGYGLSGEPSQNAHVDTFTAASKMECLNEHLIH